MDEFEIIESPMTALSLKNPEAILTEQSGVQEPSYSSSVLQSNRSDGYWVETFHFDLTHDRVPGIIASGLVSGVIEFLDNPIAESDYNARETFKCKSATADVTKGKVALSFPVRVTQTDML